MSFDQIMYYAIKVLLPLVYGYTFIKFKRAKSLDHTLKLKLKGRSMIEFYLVLIAGIAFIAYPANKDILGVFVFIGAIIFLLTYLAMERLVAVGRKVIFAKFFAFEVRLITKYFYQKGRFEFYIRSGRIKVFLPVADMTYVNEMLSGQGRRGRGRRN